MRNQSETYQRENQAAPELLLLAAIFSIIICVRFPFTGGLWLDEAITAWVTNASFAEMLERSLQVESFSPIYPTIIWLIRQLIGNSEIALRAISLLSMLAGAVILHRLARNWIGSGGALVAAMIFLSNDAVEVAALSARPYAPALFFGILAVGLAEQQKIPGSTNRVVLWSSVSALASIYLHYFFICILPVLALQLSMPREHRASLARGCIRILPPIAILLVPAYIHLASRLDSAARVRYIPAPSFSDLILGLIPPSLAISIILSVVMGAIFSSIRTVALPKRWWLVGLLGLWLILPPTCLFIASFISPNSLFLPRYFLLHTPALALACAALTKFWSSPTARRVSAATLAALLCLREVDRRWSSEDWRGAGSILASGPAARPVLLYSGLAEGRDLEWLRDPRHREYYLAPLAYYGIANPVVPLPPPLSESHRKYLQEIFSSLREDDAVLIVREQRLGTQSIKAELKAIAETNGFLSEVVPLHAGSVVHLYNLHRRPQ